MLCCVSSQRFKVEQRRAAPSSFSFWALYVLRCYGAPHGACARSLRACERAVSVADGLKCFGVVGVEVRQLWQLLRFVALHLWPLAASSDGI